MFLMSVHVARGHGGDSGVNLQDTRIQSPKLVIHNYVDIDSFCDTSHWNGIMQKKKPEGQTMDGKKVTLRKENDGVIHKRNKISCYKMLEEVDGDDSLVDQIKCLKRALGEKNRHTRGVWKKSAKI
uniref:Uncharacterized protein n=1 Tax=Lactuca sativa TaxID=4236 RepID=A0A9R1WB56_LACSA|nr:hypothetical protein LSAT_V11C200055250 [Lactuca sativa]